ncbi:MAG: class SAM-dependent methyltransferase [Chloroflexi bacterium]|jgi:SAM-dependent methyltransferase|nr:class SAM-dependent methyltransferase [Chloroflexota bacterium]
MSRESSDLYVMRPDLYDIMHADHTEDMRFLEEFTGLLGDEPQVLELGCGTGRLLVPLLDAGATVVGLDRGAEMLKVARERLALYADRVTLVEGDMRHFDLHRTFDLVVIGLNTFMHMLTTADQLACLECIRRHLRPAGLVLLDLANPHAVLRDTPMGVVQHRFTRPAPLSPDTTVTLWSTTLVATARQLTQTSLFFDEAVSSSGQLRRSVTDVYLRLVYRYELELLLNRAGFSVRNLYGDYESSPFDDDSERLICVGIAHA